MKRQNLLETVEAEVVDAVKHVDLNKLTAFEAVAMSSVAVLSVMVGVTFALLTMTA